MENNNLLITLGRQYGSGGREIGQKIAESLGINFYDKEIIKEVAEKKGVDPKIVDNAEEIANNSLIYSLSMGFFPHSTGDMNSIGNTINQMQNDIIKDLADKGHCVIVGRCADYILRKYNGCVKFFIKAPIEIRLKRCIGENRIPANSGENVVRKKDRKRASYYNCYAQGSWGSQENYDMVIDSGIIGVDGSVEVIKAFVEYFRKERGI